MQFSLEWKCGECGEALRRRMLEQTGSHAREAFWCPKCRYGWYITYDTMSNEELRKLINA